MSSNPSEPKSFDKLDSLAAQAASPHDPVMNEATKAKIKEQSGVTPEAAADRPIVKTNKGKKYRSKYSSKFHDPVPPHMLNPGPWPVPLRNPRGRLKNVSPA